MSPRAADDLVCFAVIVRKANDQRVVFSVYDDERQADSIRSRLQQLGMVAEVERVREGAASPGMTLRRART